VIEAMSQLMPNEDADTGDLVQQCLETRGIKVCVNTSLDQIRVKENLAECYFKGRNSGPETYDKVLIGIGRQPNTDNIGLENTDVEVEKGFIKVDDYLQTGVSHIYAAGDVISTAMLAHTAVYEAMIISENLKNPKSKRYENKVTPRVVYSTPEIAATGLTEKEAQEQFDDIRVINFPLEMSPKAIISQETEGRVKLIYRAGCGTLIGANLIGKASTEVIHELNLAVTCGLTVDELKNTVHAHPTMSESIWFALLKGQPFQSTAEWMTAMQEQLH